MGKIWGKLNALAFLKRYYCHNDRKNGLQSREEGIISLSTSIKKKRRRIKFGKEGPSCLKVVGKHRDGLCECGTEETAQHVSERQNLFKEASVPGFLP